MTQREKCQSGLDVQMLFRDTVWYSMLRCVTDLKHTCRGRSLSIDDTCPLRLLLLLLRLLLELLLLLLLLLLLPPRPGPCHPLIDPKPGPGPLWSFPVLCVAEGGVRMEPSGPKVSPNTSNS